MSWDVAIVGAGILGLAHALAAVKKGKKVVVFDRDAQSNGASIRNFGFVTVNGQEKGDCFAMARRSRQVWAEIAPQAGIEVLHQGMLVTARRPEAEAVIDAYLKTDMAEGCRRLTREEAAEHAPVSDAVTAALYSPHELRVESKTAIPKLAAWLAQAHGVDFRWNTEVLGVATPKIETSKGVFEAETVIFCPGDDYTGPFAERIAAYGLTRCKLQMLRVAPEKPMKLKAAVMSDLGLARYLGYAQLPEAEALKARLDAEQTAHRANGVHLIAVQSGDGSLVIGDSHHYMTTPDPFGSTEVDALMLDEMNQALDLGPSQVVERWIGTYASAANSDRWRLTDAPDEATRVVIISAGCGASTSFGIAEETVDALYA